MEPDAWEGRRAWAIDVARNAGALTLNYFRRSDLAVDRKHDDSPVTVADRRAEELLRREISARYPDDAILGEEFGETWGNSGFRWILDPIDGTKSFIHGVPLYGTMVGVEHERRSVIGVVVLPALDEYAFAARGEGSWLVRGTAPALRSTVSRVTRLAEGLLCTSAVDPPSDPAKAAALSRLAGRARVARTWGDCYGYVLLATGRAEVMIDPVMNVWDTAAVQPIVEEAGGTFTDWQGRSTMYGGEAIATNGRVLEEVLTLVRGLDT